jgi:hypothetical protein
MKNSTVNTIQTIGHLRPSRLATYQPVAENTHAYGEMPGAPVK